MAQTLAQCQRRFSTSVSELAGETDAVILAPRAGGYDRAVVWTESFETTTVIDTIPAIAVLDDAGQLPCRVAVWPI